MVVIRVVKGGFYQRAWVCTRAVTVVGDRPGAGVGDAPLDGGDRVAEAAGSVSIQNFVCVNPGFRRHAHHARVIQGGRNDARHMRAVAVVVGRIRVAVHEIPAATLIRRQVRVVYVNTRVNHANLDRATLITVGVDGLGADFRDAP